MSYFDPETYNKYNLAPKDRIEIDFLEQLLDNAVANTKCDYEYEANNNDNPIEVDIAKKQLEAIEQVESNLYDAVQGYIVSIIDDYDDEEFERYKAAGDKERKEKGIVFEKPFASLKAQQEQ